MNIQEFEEYRESLIKTIVTQAKPIHGWTIEHDYHTGSVYWVKPMPEDEFQVAVYATPLWESQHGIQLEWEVMPTGELRHGGLPYELTFDLAKDVENYFAAMEFLETFKGE